VKNRDGHANEQGERNEYLEKRDRGGAWLGEIREQGQDQNKYGAETHRASRRYQRAARRGVPQKKKRTCRSWKLSRALRVLRPMMS
jgi:hypothetical protein